MNLAGFGSNNLLRCFGPNIVILRSGSLVKSYTLSSTIFKIVDYFGAFAKGNLGDCFDSGIRFQNSSNRALDVCCIFLTGREHIAIHRTDRTIGKHEIQRRRIKCYLFDTIGCIDSQFNRLRKGHSDF